MHESSNYTVSVGSVGLSDVAVLGMKQHMFGIDINATRIMDLKECYGRTGEVTLERLHSTNTFFTFSSNKLLLANINTIAFPSSIHLDLNPLLRSEVIWPR